MTVAMTVGLVDAPAASRAVAPTAARVTHKARTTAARGATLRMAGRRGPARVTGAARQVVVAARGAKVARAARVATGQPARSPADRLTDR